MVFKTLKPPEKEVEKLEIKTPKTKARISTSDKQPQIKSFQSSDPQTPLRAFKYFGRDAIDDPQVRLKLLELAPRNPGQEASTGLQEFIKHMKKIISEKKNPFKQEIFEAKEGVFRGDEINDGKCEKFAKDFDAPSRKDSGEKIKRTEKVDLSSKRSQSSSKSRRSRTGSCGKRRDGKANAQSFKKKDSQTPRFEKGMCNSRQQNSLRNPNTPKSESIAEPEKKKKLKKSEIPLLKNRRNLDRRTELVSVLVQKCVVENDSTTSISLYQKNSSQVYDVESLSEVEVPTNGSSSKVVRVGKTNQLKNSEIQELEESEEKHLDRCVKRANILMVTKISDTIIDGVYDKRTIKATKVKTVDLDKVKTSSFTVLRSDGNSFTRLKSFHDQNVITKENVHHESNLKTSKLRIVASNASVNSVKSNRRVSSSRGSRVNKSTPRKAKKTKTDSQEGSIQKKSFKPFETPHLDICKRIIATGKVGCLIPKKLPDDKDLKNLKIEGKKIVLSPEEIPRKEPNKRPVAQERAKAKIQNVSEKEPVKLSSKNGKNSKKKKVKKPQQSEEVERANSSTFIAQRREDTKNVQERKLLETGNVKRTAPSGNIHQKPIQDALDDEVKLTAKELANLIVKNAALHFDKSEKPTGEDKVKLNMKTDKASEEDISSSDLLECESFGDVSRMSFDWLMRNTSKCWKKVSGNVKALEKDKTTKENLSSDNLLSDELKATESEWQDTEPSFQGVHQSLSSIKKIPRLKPTAVSSVDKKTKSATGDWRSFSGEIFNCSMNDNRPDTKVRSGFTRSSNRDEKIFEEGGLKLRRRNSEPYSFRGFIWKRADVSFPKSLKPSVSSVPSSLRHLNTDDIDDFIFWEAVPQKMTSCWEMSLYHFKRPWSVLSCSVFKDNRRANTPGVILESLRSGGLTHMRTPLVYQNDKINRRKGNIFDVEPSISQKNIDIRNWLAALNFTTCISNSSDVISEGTFSTPPLMSSPKQQANPKRRNVAPEFRIPEKPPEKKLGQKGKHPKLDKWNISDMDDLKELVRRESGSYVTKEQHVLSELTSPRSSLIPKPCPRSNVIEDKSVSGENGDKKTPKEFKNVKRVEISCQSGPPKPEEIATKDTLTKNDLSETPERPSLNMSHKRTTSFFLPEVNVWKYLFLFTLIFIIFQYSVGGTFNFLKY